MREFIDFALDYDLNQEIEAQKRILEKYPDSARAHFDLAVLYYSQKRVAEAIAEFNEAIRCAPDFATAHRKLGEVYVALDELERAGQCALKAADLGDRTLLDMFERYPAVRVYVERRSENS